VSSASPATPWYESNLLWGAVGVIIAVIAGGKHDLRWLFLLAWPCLSFPMWRLANRTRWGLPVGVSGVVLIGGGLLALSIWLKPAAISVDANPLSSSTQVPPPNAGPERLTTPAPIPRDLHHKKPPKNTPGTTQDGTDNNQTVIQGGAVVQQNGTGDCSPNIIGSGNTATCNLQALGDLRERTIELSKAIMTNLYERGWMEGRVVLPPGHQIFLHEPGPHDSLEARKDWLFHATDYFRFKFAPRVIAIQGELASAHFHDPDLDRFVELYPMQLHTQVPLPVNAWDIQDIAESLNKLANQIPSRTAP
jgi:hypothetical protein